MAGSRYYFSTMLDYDVCVLMLDDSDWTTKKSDDIHDWLESLSESVRFLPSNPISNLPLYSHRSSIHNDPTTTTTTFSISREQELRQIQLSRKMKKLGVPRAAPRVGPSIAAGTIMRSNGTITEVSTMEESDSPLIPSPTWLARFAKFPSHEEHMANKMTRMSLTCGKCLRRGLDPQLCDPGHMFGSEGGARGGGTMMSHVEAFDAWDWVGVQRGTWMKWNPRPKGWVDPCTERSVPDGVDVCSYPACGAFFPRSSFLSSTPTPTLTSTPGPESHDQPTMTMDNLLLKTHYAMTHVFPHLFGIMSGRMHVRESVYCVEDLHRYFDWLVGCVCRREDCRRFLDARNGGMGHSKYLLT